MARVLSLSTYSLGGVCRVLTNDCVSSYPGLRENAVVCPRTDVQGPSRFCRKGQKVFRVSKTK